MLDQYKQKINEDTTPESFTSVLGLLLSIVTIILFTTLLAYPSLLITIFSIIGYLMITISLIFYIDRTFGYCFLSLITLFTGGLCWIYMLTEEHYSSVALSILILLTFIILCFHLYVFIKLWLPTIKLNNKRSYYFKKLHHIKKLDLNQFDLSLFSDVTKEEMYQNETIMKLNIVLESSLFDLELEQLLDVDNYPLPKKTKKKLKNDMITEYASKMVTEIKKDFLAMKTNKQTTKERSKQDYNALKETMLSKMDSKLNLFKDI